MWMRSGGKIFQGNEAVRTDSKAAASLTRLVVLGLLKHEKILRAYLPAKLQKQQNRILAAA